MSPFQDSWYHVIQVCFVNSLSLQLILWTFLSAANHEADLHPKKPDQEQKTDVICLVWFIFETFRNEVKFSDVIVLVSEKVLQEWGKNMHSSIL